MKRLTRLAAAVGAAAVAGAGLVAFTASTASAATLGSITITYPGKPNPGGDQTLFNGSIANAQCPAGTSDSFFMIVGPDLPYPNGFLGQGPVNGRGPVSFTGASIANTKTANEGSFSQPGTTEYTIRFDCIQADGSASDMYTTKFFYTNPAKTWTVDESFSQPTTTTLSASPPSPQEQGTNVTLTADVNPDNAPGKVEFYDGTTKLGEDTTLSATGGADFATAALAVGTHSLTAKFVPTNPANFAGSTSAPISYQITSVAPRPTTATLTVSPTSGAPYQSVTLTCAVSAATGTPAGTARFLDGSSLLGQAPLTNGSASITTSNLGPGAHSLTCEFVGTAPYQNSTSAARTATYDAAAGATPDDQTVVVTIPAGQITITTPYTPEAPLNLGTAVLDSATSTYSASALFDKVTVTDTRAGTSGWTAKLVAGAFSNGTSTFPGSHAGFTNVTAIQKPGNAMLASDVVPVNTTPNAPGIGSPTTFATYPKSGSTAKTGSVDLTATFGIAGVPTSVTAGQYTSTVTFTAV